MANLERKDLSVHIADQIAENQPDAAPDFKIIRGTSGIIQSSPTYVTSNEIVIDGQAAQQVQDRTESTLTREFDVTKETVRLFKDVIHGVEADNTVLSVVTIGSTATGFISTNNDFVNLSVGDWFTASGFTDTDLNVLFKVSAKADDNNIDTSTAPASIEAEGASVTFDSLKISAGITKTLKTLQNRVFDGSKVASTDYASFLNCFASVGSFSVEKSGIVTGSIEYKVPKPVSGTAALPSQTDSAKDTSDVVSAINNVSAFYENGINSNCNIQTLSIEFNNNYEGDGGAAGCTDEQFGRGTISVTGSVLTRTVKSDSMVWSDKNKNGTRQAIAVGLKWPDGDWAIFEITQAVITTHTFTDGDVVVANQMDYAADPDAVTGTSFQIFTNIT